MQAAIAASARASDIRRLSSGMPDQGRRIFGGAAMRPSALRVISRVTATVETFGMLSQQGAISTQSSPVEVVSPLPFEARVLCGSPCFGLSEELACLPSPVASPEPEPLRLAVCGSMLEA